MKTKIRPRLTDVEKLKLPSPEKIEKMDNQHQSLKQLLRPYLLALAFSGCYSLDEGLIMNRKEILKTGRANSVYRIFGKIYRILSFIIIFALCVKAAAAFYNIGDTFKYLNIVIVAWYIQCLVVLIFFLKFEQSNDGDHRNYYEFWNEKIWSAMDDLGIVFPVEKIKKKQMVFLMIIVFLTICNVGGLAFLSTDVLSNGYGAFWSAPFHKSVVVVTLFLCAITFLSLMWYTSLGYVMLLSSILSTAFEVANNFLARQMTADVKRVSCIFPKVRMLHLNLSKIVSDLDKYFGYYFALMFVIGLGQSCLILYILLKYSLDTFQMGIYAFWAVNIIGTNGTVAVVAALVNDTVSLFEPVTSIR